MKGLQKSLMDMQNIAIQAATANKENMIPTVQKLVQAMHAQVLFIKVQMEGGELPQMEEMISEMCYDALVEYTAQLEVALAYLEQGGDPEKVSQFIQDNAY